MKTDIPYCPFCSLLPLATIENFNVVETLSENAVIVYQTHKVRAARSQSKSLCLIDSGMDRLVIITFCIGSVECEMTEIICYSGCGLHLRGTCCTCLP